MGISPIRKYTEEDRQSVRRSAERFCKRHGITCDDGEPEHAIEYAIEYGGPLGDRDCRMAKLWTACYCRALGFARPDVQITVAYGYVGYNCD